MRTIEQTGTFRRDLKRVKKGSFGEIVDRLLIAVVPELALDRPLDIRYRDHPLTGNWADHRDCHLWPDLVLVHRKPDAETLQLVRLGSHSELRL